MAPAPAALGDGLLHITIEAKGKLGLSLGPSGDDTQLEVKAVAPVGLAAAAACAAAACAAAACAGTGAEPPQLRAGLVVSAVMGKSTEGLPPAAVLQLIKAAGRPLKLGFADGSAPQAPAPARTEPLGAAGSIAELPSAVQLQIASMATARPAVDAATFEPAASVGYCRYDRITAPLAEERCCSTVADGFVADALAHELRATGRRMDAAGELRPAGVGTGPTHRQDSAVRGDRIAWLPHDTEEFPLSILLRQFNALREALAGSAPRWAPMRGGHCRCMLACYPTGSRYVRHRDTSPLLPGRVATAILYLNDDWKQGDGGELALHPDGAGAVSSTVPPALGRLVVFDSRTEHEVLEFRGRERWAITSFMYRAEATPPPLTSALSGVPRILVAIASYRDEECPHTVDALFKTASCPERVSVAVLDQSDHATDGDCVSPEARARRPGQIGVHTLHWSLAKGPCWARAMLQQCLEGEGYYLQIDSHMRFVDGWDELLLRQLSACKAAAADKPILSTYPLGYHRPVCVCVCRASMRYHPPTACLLRHYIQCCSGVVSVSQRLCVCVCVCGCFVCVRVQDRLPAHRLPTLLCADGFRTADVDGRDMPPSLRLRARVLLIPPVAPVRSLFWAAGFSFSSSEAAVEVPYDDSLKFLFFGEVHTIIMQSCPPSPAAAAKGLSSILVVIAASNVGG